MYMYLCFGGHESPNVMITRFRVEAALNLRDTSFCASEIGDKNGEHQSGRTTGSGDS